MKKDNLSNKNKYSYITSVSFQKLFLCFHQIKNESGKALCHLPISLLSIFHLKLPRLLKKASYLVFTELENLEISFHLASLLLIFWTLKETMMRVVSSVAKIAPEDCFETPDDSSSMKVQRVFD